MCNRIVSEDVIIGIWLKRERKGKVEEYNKSHPGTPIAMEMMNKLIFRPNHQSVEENRLRRDLLWPTRGNLLLSVRGATWSEADLPENDFKSLHLIRSLEWLSPSNYSGELQTVAERAYEERSTFALNPDAYEREKIKAINEMEESGSLDLDLILLRSQDSQFTTIFEGNHTAAALYIKCYLKKEMTYAPFRVFVGKLLQKVSWQW